MPVIAGGVRVAGFISPTDSTDIYAVIDPIYGVDGLRSVADTVERDAITVPRRREGMLVYSRSDGKYYKLNSDLTTWTDFGTTLGSGGGGLSTLSTSIAPAATHDIVLGATASYLHTKLIFHSNTVAKWFTSELLISRDQTELSIGYGLTEYAALGEILVLLQLMIIGPNLVLRITNNEAVTMNLKVTTVINL